MNKLYGKINPHQFSRKSWSCPGHLFHRYWAEKNGKHLSPNLFDKYVHKSHKKYQLYWRLHPDAMLAVTKEKW
jgi:hypothetical protein